MTPRDARITARTIRTQLGTTHTIYRVDGREFHDVDALEAHLGEEIVDVSASSPQLEAAP